MLSSEAIRCLNGVNGHTVAILLEVVDAKSCVTNDGFLMLMVDADLECICSHQCMETN